MEQVEGGDRRWFRVLAPLALFALAFVVRALPYQTVLLADRTLFFGSDAYYHMRRIVYSIVRFPEVLRFDPYINFPDGSEPIWTPLFDWGIAALLRPFWGHVAPLRLEQFAVWIPPLLGAGTVVALYGLARRHFGTSVALIAGAVLSVMSAHFWYSQVGFVDHHAAVALCTTWVLAAGMSLLATSSRSPAGLRPGRRAAVVAGFSLGASLLLWPGSLLHVGLVETAFLVHLLSRSRREDAIGFAWRLWLLHSVALALLLPFAAASEWTRWSRFSPVVLSYFQPWYFGTAALFSAACALGWRWAGDGRARRGAAAAAIGAVLLLVSAGLFPELMHSAGDVWEWFAKQDSFQDQVAESSPLFFALGRFTLIPALQRLSFFALLVPLALVLGVIAVRHDRHRSPVLLFLWWTLGLSVVTAIQKRFFNSASVCISLLFALSVCWTYARLPAGIVRRAAFRRLAKLGIAGFTLLLLLPTLATYGTYAENQLGRLSGRKALVAPHIRKQVAAVEMANWLRLRTPATSGWLDASRRPEYGILAPWTIGHVLEYEARRPTVTDNFGDDIGRKNYLLARLYFQSREPAATDLLDRLGVRYVVAQFAPNYLGEEPVPGSMFFSLFRHDGSATDPPPNEREGGALPLPALTRHRLIYDSQALAPSGQSENPLYKVFEYVAGAQVVGRAAPGAKIGATLPLRTHRGRSFVYDARTEASADGHYALRLPYATSGGPPEVRAAPHYVLRCAGDAAELGIDEQSVRTGAEIVGPDLCLAR